MSNAKGTMATNSITRIINDGRGQLATRDLGQNGHVREMDTKAAGFAQG